MATMKLYRNASDDFHGNLQKNMHKTWPAKCGTCKRQPGKLFLNADPLLRWLAPESCDHMCITLTPLCRITILTTQTLDRCREKTDGHDRRLGVFDRGVQAKRTWVMHKWQPGWVFNVRSNKRSGGTRHWRAFSDGLNDASGTTTTYSGTEISN